MNNLNECILWNSYGIHGNHEGDWVDWVTGWLVAASDADDDADDDDYDDDNWIIG